MYRLRELEREDISIINIWRSSKELIDYLGAPFRYINKEVDDRWFDNYMLNRDKNIRCSIINEDNKLVGLVSLTNIDNLNKSAIFHIMIGDDCNQNKGIGFYATKELLNHAFLDINLNRIELMVLKSNIRAIKLYNKVGFKQEGVKRSAVFKNGSYVDLIQMGILKNEFWEGSNL